MIMDLNVVFCHGRPKASITSHLYSVQDLLRSSCNQHNVDDTSNFYMVCNGHILDGNHLLENGKTYHVVPRLLGGKGGFGSMLRAIGAQIEKTTSREACRDLSGRRMRDINNEKKLKEWMSKEAEREKEKNDRRQERLERQLNPAQHKFDDPQYFEQRAKVQEDLEDALATGLKRAHKKGETSGSCPPKKAKTPKSLNKEWLGMDIDSDDLDSDSDTEAHPGDPDTEAHPGDPDTDNGATISEDSAVDVKSEDGSSENILDPDLKVNDAGEYESSKCSELEVKNKSSTSLLSQLPPPTSVDSKDIKQENIVADVDPTTPVDLDQFDSVEGLIALGLERLKCALMSRGLKCGGTLAERAARLFSVKGLHPDEIDPSLIAKAKGKGKKSK